MSAVVTAVSDVEVARSVLATEAAGLHSLAASLDRSFDRAIDLLAACTGRVVASGMGKSGHVARKVAATMASTGSPAIFVHPAEASHGDLGMRCCCSPTPGRPPRWPTWWRTPAGSDCR